MRGYPLNPLTKLNMKQQLVLLFILMVSPVFLLHWYGNYQAEKLLKNHVTNAYVELIKQNHTLISRDIDTVSKITATIIQNPITQKLIPSEQDTVMERVKKYDDVAKLLTSYSISLNGGEAVYYSLYIYDPNNYYYFAPKRQIQQAGVYFFSDNDKPVWFDDAINKRGNGYIDIIKYTLGLNQIDTLAYIRAVGKVKDGNGFLGVLVANKMDMKIAESLRSVSLPEGVISYVDSSNRILSSTIPVRNGDTLELPSELQEGNRPAPYNYSMLDNRYRTTDVMTSDFIYIMSQNESVGHKLIYQIPVQSLLKQQNELKRIIQLITVAYIVLGCIVLVYFWSSLMTPLQRLARFVRSYEPGKLVPETPVKRRHDEVGVLMSALYDMARRINSLIHYKYHMDLKAKESQLRLLHQQINPHLLYNTLESIYWKSTLEGNSESSEMIKELSKLMKIGLSQGRELIRFEEELEHASAYVNLQLKRYSYKFNVIWDIPDTVKLIRIPKISLQPLIENAIIHGVKQMGEDGEIQISAALEGERVTIKVEDNGYKQVNIAAMDHILNDENVDHKLGYGIRNIHQRFQLHFGNKFGLSYHRREKDGTTALLVLPATYEEPIV
ncbi:cache domain-containing sensor histidine kinase [Paenibacillus endoradicis]|uniref:cache domain-containing sensor histidine kinase n=1 Tax=Paenibacillus endoradicis TaxID=2972487 RepID=UPI002158B4A9|nr:sensor histidine kinase [Paenibacillus endoradicis]MCR8659600.1 histidine kinase [Paenibacillus endoradicis]